VHQSGDLRRNIFGQPNLWGYGISGDLPIVVVRVQELGGVAVGGERSNAANLSADLVILNEHPADYLDEVGAADEAGGDARHDGIAGEARRRVSSSLRGDSRGRPPPLLRGCASGGAWRSG
jgi:hypothetical protein